MQPPVEFIQGIPDDLDKDSFIDPYQRNLLILDDLMTSSVKDPRLTDLFAEGSHHRNLSVIVLSHNLYFSKDPKQRRNCHYLVLFKNPVDKQQIMMLARQMHPNNVRYFMGEFDKATQEPYSHLLMDLKPNTPESERLIKGSARCTSLQLVADSPRVHTVPPVEQTAQHTVQSDMATVNTGSKSVQACEDCGQVFGSVFDLYKHVRQWCPENNESHMKKRRDDSDSNSENDTNDKWTFCIF